MKMEVITPWVANEAAETASAWTLAKIRNAAGLCLGEFVWLLHTVIGYIMRMEQIQEH